MKTPISFEMDEFGDLVESKEFLSAVKKEHQEQDRWESTEENLQNLHRCFHGKVCIFLENKQDDMLVCTKINKGLAGLRECPQKLWSFYIKKEVEKNSVKTSWYDNNKRLHLEGIVTWNKNSSGSTRKQQGSSPKKML